MPKFKCVQEKSGIELDFISESFSEDFRGNIIFSIENQYNLTVPKSFNVYKEDEFGFYELIFSDGYSVVKQEKESYKIILESKQEIKNTKNKIDLEEYFFNLKKNIQKPHIKHKAIIDSLIKEKLKKHSNPDNLISENKEEKIKEDIKSKKPPLGLTPLKIHNEKRLQEINDAIQRYCEADKFVPMEWIEEKQYLELKLK